ncbi:variable large family protein, partial [Borreliella garinii]|uniref:variable large family protein n=2 Tax=Borreliella garinii TaxID=29519 RepID=UPI001AEF3F4D
GKKNDQIAAALVLRGVAKDGKFAAAADGGAESIGNVNAGGAGANADANAVKGIAGAMKGIVEADRKVDGVKFEPAAAADASGDGNKKAGKLFGTNAATAGDAKEAAAAVGAVSGEQILSAIVAAAGSGDQTGKAANTATNAIEAAIGGGAGANADFGVADGKIGKKNDQIAAALVLRG